MSTGNTAPDGQPSYQQYLIPDPLGPTVLRKCGGFVAILVAMLLTLVFSASLDGVFKIVTGEISRAWWLLALVLTLVSGMLFPLFARMGLGLIARSGATVLKNDPRPTTLYLRSFQDDARFIDRGDFWRLLFFPARYETPERSLAKAVDDVGTLVAIGKPGETLRPCGAARMYVDGEHWQKVVAELIARSRVVILRIGRTRGFWWEMQHVLERCDPCKILVYLPPGDRGAHYDYLRQQAAGVLPHPLPERAGNALFLAFGPGWEPRLLDAGEASIFSRLRRLVTGSPAPLVREALNPALAATGVPDGRMPVRLHEWFALASTSIAVLVMLAAVPLSLLRVQSIHSYEIDALDHSFDVPGLPEMDDELTQPRLSEFLERGDIDLTPREIEPMLDLPAIDLDASLIDPAVVSPNVTELELSPSSGAPVGTSDSGKRLEGRPKK